MTETTVAVQKNQSSGPHPCDVSIGNLAKKSSGVWTRSGAFGGKPSTNPRLYR